MPAGSIPAQAAPRPTASHGGRAGHPRRPVPRAGATAPLHWLICGLLLLFTGLLPFGLLPTAAWASLENDRYDGNIFALYAGNGSLVPPRSSLAEARAEGRVAVVVYYLDDSSVSKRFAPVVSELQRLWGNSIELIPLVTDPLPPVSEANRRERAALPADDPGRYWSGVIPEVVVFDRSGTVAFQASGQVPLDGINAALSRATGLPLPQSAGTTSTRSFNELNSEVVTAP